LSARVVGSRGTTRETVVYVHGLWLTGHEALLLRRRLERAFGYDVRAFRYPSVVGTMSEITASLHEFIRALGARQLHLVGHSLGGLVIYRLLERFPEQPPGSVVFMGTPSVACRAAVRVARVRWAAATLGRCIAEELLVERERRWMHSRPLGIIAGSRPFGLGRLVARLEDENDGTIAVSETRLPGAADHITLPVSHMGLLASGRAARETGAFLREGRFSLSPRPPA
jgi:pimeloyl-ACP methyl ester carboxylesterase